MTTAATILGKVLLVIRFGAPESLVWFEAGGDGILEPFGRRLHDGSGDALLFRRRNKNN